MSFQSIPINNDPNQSFQVTIEVNERNWVFNLFVSFNIQAGYWIMNILDSTRAVVLTGIPLITDANLLEQFEYLNIGSIYILNYTGADKDYPDENGWDDFIMIWGDNG